MSMLPSDEEEDSETDQVSRIEVVRVFFFFKESLIHLLVLFISIRDASD